MSAAVQPPETWLSLFSCWRPPFRRGKILLIGGLLSVGLIVIDVTAYLELLTGPGYDQRVDPATREIQTSAFPCYSFEGRVAKSGERVLKLALQPAHQLDRLCRPRVWSPPFSKYSPTSSESSIFNR